MKYTLEKGNNIVPYGVTELIIPEGCMINVTIPETVTSLYDSREYVDTSIPLPLSITHLTIANLNYDLKQGSLPHSLTHLIIKRLEKVLQKGILPPFLKYLEIHETNSIKIHPGSIPDNLEYLEFKYGYWPCISRGIIPSNLKVLKFCHSLHLSNEYILPDSIEVIRIRDGNIYTFTQSSAVKYDIILPKNLKEFYFNSDGPNVLSYIFPKNMKKISFGHNFDSEIGAGILPENLEILIFGNSYNRSFKEGVLPKGLKNLNLGNKFNQIIENGILPDSLEIIALGEKYNKPINKNVLPEGLKVIIFGDNYDQVIEPDVLPSTLKHIVFGKNFTKKLIFNGKKVLPEYIDNVDIYNKYYCIYHRAFSMNMNIRIISKKTNSFVDATNDIRRLLLIDQLLPQPISDPVLFYLKRVSDNNHDSTEDYIKRISEHVSRYDYYKKKSVHEYKIYSFELCHNGKFDNNEYVYNANDCEKKYDKYNDNYDNYDTYVKSKGWTIVPAGSTSARRAGPYN